MIIQQTLIETDETSDIPGLSYLPNYISAQEQDFLIRQIDQQPWLPDLKRRVQHYGYKYDYKARTIDQQLFLGPLPEWLQVFARRLTDDTIFHRQPEQIIVNEYLPGQGISPHIDCTPCFRDIIVSLSLGSDCRMEFSHVATKQKKSIHLAPGSLVVLSDDARYHWEHAIPARKSDMINGIKTARTRRISLTFRNVILNT